MAGRIENEISISLNSKPDLGELSLLEQLWNALISEVPLMSIFNMVIIQSASQMGHNGLQYTCGPVGLSVR